MFESITAVVCFIIVVVIGLGAFGALALQRTKPPPDVTYMEAFKGADRWFYWSVRCRCCQHVSKGSFPGIVELRAFEESPFICEHCKEISAIEDIYYTY